MIEKRPLKYLLGNPLKEFLIPKCGFKVLKSLSISRALIRISTWNPNSTSEKFVIKSNSD